MKNNLIILIALLILMVSSVLFNIKISGYYSIKEDPGYSFVLSEKKDNNMEITILPGEKGYSNIVQIKNINDEIMDEIKIQDCYTCEDIKKIYYNIENLNKGSYKVLVFDFTSEKLIEKSFTI